MSEQPCPDERGFDELLRGQLTAAQTAEIERHVECCPRCLAELERITTPAQPWIKDFRRLVSASDETPIDFQKVLDRIGELSCEARSNTALAVAQRLIETSRIGDYDLLGELRSGGMGRVFRVRRRSTSEVFALKILTPERLPRPESIERFQREIRLLRDLRHQHVVRAIDSGVWRGIPFVVMEFLDGINLDELVRREKSLTVPDAMELARQIGLGLRYVHDLKLVHRDIKPSNVMLTADRVCLLDLGLARVAETDWEVTGPTMTGEALGTLRYAAPEQLGRAHDVDSRADLYGLGGTLLWLLTGQPPFASSDPREVWRLKLGDSTGSDPSIELLATRVDADVVALVRRLLASSPDDRPSSVDAVLPDLERLAVGHQIGSLWKRASSERRSVQTDSPERPINVVMTVLEAEPKRTQLHRWVVGLTSLLVTTAVWSALANRRGPLPRESGDSEQRQSASRTPESGQKSSLVPSSSSDSLTFAADFLWPDSRIPLETLATMSVRDQPLSMQALVSHPAAIAGIDSWTIETRQPRSHLYEVAFSADGRCYATGDDAGVVRVFESATDRLLRMFVVGSRVRSLDWSNAGPWLAIGCSEPEVVVFDAAAGRRLAHLRLEFGIAHRVCWHPDGVELAAAGGKGFLIHDLQTSSSREVVVPDCDGVVSLNWSPDGMRVVTGDRRGRIRIWNASDGALDRELARQPARLSHVAWSPDGDALSFATDKGQVEVVSLDNNAAWSLEGHLPQAFPLEALWLNATTLLTNDGIVLRWFQLPQTRTKGSEAERLEPMRTQMNPLQIPRRIYGGGSLHRLAVSRDGTQAVSALRFARRVWRLDLSAGTNRIVGDNQSTSGFDSRAAWSPRGRWIAFAQQTRGAWVIDSRTLEPRHFVALPEAIGSLAWSPDGERLAVIETGRVSIFSKLAETSLERRSLPPCGSVTGSWSPDGHRLATSGWGEKRTHSLRLLDTASWGESLRTPLAGDAYLIHAWSPDQKSLAVGTDQEVLLFDAALHEWRQKFPIGDRVNGLCWHPTDRLLAAVTVDGRPRVINVETGDTRELDVLGNPATGILWSAEGRRITVQFGREMACFDWPAGTLRWRQPLNGHSIESLTQSPSGETLVVAVNGELRLQDSATGRQVVTLLTVGDQNWLRIRPDGHYAGSLGVESELVIVHESNGVQSVSTPSAFAAQSGWKNEPTRAAMPTLQPGRHDSCDSW